MELVIARNYQQFSEYVVRQGHNPSDMRKPFHYIRDPQDLLGYDSETPVIFLRGSHTRDDYPAINRSAAVRFTHVRWE